MFSLGSGVTAKRPAASNQDRPIGPFEVILIDDDGSTPEVVAVVDDYLDAERFSREWLMLSLIHI